MKKNEFKVKLKRLRKKSFSCASSYFHIARRRWSSKSTTFLIAGLILFSAIAGSAGIIFWKNFSLSSADKNTIWADKTDKGIILPACASSSANSTCQNQMPSATISWTQVGDHACNIANLFINASPGTLTQSWENPNTNAGWSYKAVDSTYFARRFTANSAYTLSQTSFYVAKEAGSTGTLWATVESDDLGFPSGVPLANGTSVKISAHDVCTWGACGTWIVFNFPGVALTLNTQYWVVVRGDSSSALLPWARTGDNDTGRKSIIRNGSWNVAATDIVYRNYSLPSGTSPGGTYLSQPCSGNNTSTYTSNNTSYEYRLDFYNTSGIHIESSNGSFITSNCIPPPLTVSCSVAPISAITKQLVTWSAAVSGGIGSYNYNWTGSDGLSGSGPSASKSYGSPGNKNATITVGSGSQTVSISECSSLINGVTVYEPSLSVNPSSATLEAQDTVQLQALYDRDGPLGPDTAQDVTMSSQWSSDNPAKAPVNNAAQKGLVTGESPGTATVSAGYTDAYGNQLSSPSQITVSNSAQTLLVSLSADPSSGVAPLSTNITASVSGTAEGTINYSFWWNCDNTTTDVETASVACGSLPSPTAGNCAENENGYKCEAIAETSKTIAHVYSSEGNYKPKVIVERGSASPDEDRDSVSVNLPPLSVSCSAAPSSAQAEQYVNWTAVPSGGSEPYAYLWSGSAPLSGKTENPASVSYSESGNKTGAVTVTSGSQSEGPVSCSNNVSVSGSVLSFVAVPVTISEGESSWLSWSTSGFSLCVIDHGIGPVPTTGTIMVTPNVTTTYRLICNPGGVSQDATVNVRKSPEYQEIPP